MFPFVTPYVLALIHMSLTGSVYTTIALAVERCITVLAPFTKIKVSDDSAVDSMLFLRNSLFLYLVTAC